VRHEFSEGAARRIALEALATIAVGGASAAMAASPALELSTYWSRLLVGLALGGGFSCALGLVLLRQRGRSILASMLRGTKAS
jgi:hypothetical protein